MVVARAELCGATPFRMLDLGWRLGMMVVPKRSNSGAIPFRIFDFGGRLGTRVVRSEAIAERHLSELST